MARSRIYETKSTRKTSVRLEWHGEEIKDKIRAAQMQGIGAGVDQLRDAAKSRCPVRRGDLQKSIKSRMNTQGKVEGYVVAGGKGAHHAHLIELGTVTIPPNPFMRETFDTNVGRVKKVIRNRIKEVVP